MKLNEIEKQLKLKGNKYLRLFKDIVINPGTINTFGLSWYTSW